MSRKGPSPLTHPPGYDADLVRRAESSQFRVGHGFAKLRETYWAACVLGRERKAAACETRLRQLLQTKAS